MGIVDRDKQEKIMVEIDQIFNKHELMPDEKMFIINAVIGRIRQVQEKQKMSDLMTQNVSGGLLKNIMKKAMGQGGNEDGEE